MTESGDFDPGPWSGHDFKSAYARYDGHVGRSYGDAVSTGKTAAECLEPSIETNCTNPLVIMVDVTGSMGEWPKWIFSKLPYLELEGKEYLGKDMEIAFGAIGDANQGDKYAVQMRPFTSGTDLKKRLEELVIERGGGGGGQETYELGALYCVHNVSMPNAIKPILIMVGDERPYDFVTSDEAVRVAGVKIQGRIMTEEIFAELKARFAVYLIRKPYEKSAGDTMSQQDQDNVKAWSALLGADHICDLPEAQRVVDVIFGILAKETGRIEYFRDELNGRQKPGQVQTVMKSLATVHALPAPGATSRAGNSILKLPYGGKGGHSKRLTD